MRITLLRAKELFQKSSPADELNYRLNRVSERFILNGKFMGSMAKLKLAAPYGQVSLPRGFRTAEGAKIDGRVADITNRWWEYLPGKPPASFAGAYELLEDMGDGHANMYSYDLLPLLAGQTKDSTLVDPDFPPGSGTIKATYSGGNINITIEGRDINEMPVTLTLANQSAQANPFARISRIHKEQNVAALIEFTAAAPDSRVVTLARMEANEEETYYRRYLIRSLQTQPNVAVSVFCKRRHIEFTKDSDVLPFTNISALEQGLSAYNFEQENDQTLADQLWASGIEILNKELGDANAADQIPPLRIHGLTPLRSHM
jgi:hypothetical protein